MPVCTTAGVATFLGLYLGGALGFVYGTATSRELNPMTLAFWLGLGGVGLVAMGASIFTGLAVSAVVPVAAHAMFARDENAPTAAPSAVTPAQPGQASAARADAVARPVAY